MKPRSGIAAGILALQKLDTVNKRSFKAHTRKANIDVIDHFDFNGNHYYGLALLTAGTSLEN